MENLVDNVAIDKASALVEALGYIQRFHNKVIVVKVGGSIMDDEQALTNLLNEADPQAFDFRNDGLRWRDWRASTAEVAQARREFAHSFGSCSFEEPIDDLRALGLMK